MYSLSHHLYSQQNFDIKWIKCLEKILNESGFSNIWQTQTFKSIEWLKQSIKQTLLDQFLQDWNSSVHNSLKHLIIEFSKLILDLKNILIF